MKLLLLVLALSATSVTAMAFQPECVNVGTRSEGWTLPDGKIAFDNCLDKVAYCGAIGSKSEGWYVAEVADKQLLAYDECSVNKSQKPSCVNIGSKSEGWQAPNGKLMWDKCSEKVAACLAVGTRSEGWYAAIPDYDTAKRLSFANCALDKN